MSHMLTRGTILYGHYRIEGRLGGGGFGDVYLATHNHLKSRHAIKVNRSPSTASPVQKQFQELFKTEARLLAGLSHPNLAKVTEFFEEGGVGYIVMEYVDGTDLGEALGSPLPEPQVLAIASQLLDVLEYLHGQPNPVIVRDLKPQNVMVAQGGSVRLIDFGIAKVLEAGRDTSTTIRGAGSPGFAPIEQYGGGGTDQRSDLYSLGATLLCLLSGSDIPEATELATGRRSLPDPRVVNPTVTNRTWEAIQLLMEIRQSDRPSSAAEARSLLFGAPRATQAPHAVPKATPQQSPLPPTQVAPASPVVPQVPAPASPPSPTPPQTSDFDHFTTVASRQTVRAMPAILTLVLLPVWLWLNAKGHAGVSVGHIAWMWFLLIPCIAPFAAPFVDEISGIDRDVDCSAVNICYAAVDYLLAGLFLLGNASLWSLVGPAQPETNTFGFPPPKPDEILSLINSVVKFVFEIVYSPGLFSLLIRLAYSALYLFLAVASSRAAVRAFARAGHHK